jgi:methionyl-tRNA synthetase
MSKSKNNVIDPVALLDDFDPEIIKYFLVRKLQLDHDGTFSIEILKETYNAELVNTFGNLVARTVKMFAQNFDDFTLRNVKSCIKYDNEFNDKIIEMFGKYRQNMDVFQLNDAFKAVITLGKYSNNYIDLTMP